MTLTPEQYSAYRPLKIDADGTIGLTTPQMSGGQPSAAVYSSNPGVSAETITDLFSLPATRSHRALSGWLGSVASRYVESAQGHSRLGPDMAFFDLLDITHDQSNGQPEIKSRVQPVSWLFEKSFPQESEAWRGAVAHTTGHILRSLATAHANSEDNRCNFPKDGVYRKFAEVHGSMARSIYCEDKTKIDTAAKTLMSAKNNLGAKLSGFTKQVLEETTFIYDIDIAHDPNLTYEEIWGELSKCALSVSQNADGSCGISLPGDNGKQLPGQVMAIDIGRTKAMKVKIKPPDGPEFSIDIFPKAEPAALHEDFRMGAQNSSRANAGVIDLVVAQDERNDPTIGISGDPQILIENAAASVEPSKIVEPGYETLEQGVLAFLRHIRYSIVNPGKHLEVSGTENTSDFLRKIMMPSVILPFIKTTLENPIASHENSYRLREVVREALVLMCMDHKSFIQELKSSQFDLLFGIDQDFLWALSEQEPEELRKMMTEDAHFLDKLSRTFDLSLKNAPRILLDQHKTDPSQEERGQVMERATKRAKARTIRHHIAPNGQAVFEGNLNAVSCIDWIIPVGSSDHFTHSEASELSRLESMKPVAQAVFMPEKHAADIYRLARVSPAFPGGINEFYNLLLSMEIPEKMKQLIEIFAYPQLIGDLLGERYFAVGSSPYQLYIKEGLPIALIELYNLSSGKQCFTLTHPLGIHPEHAISVSKTNIDKKRRSFKQYSRLLQSLKESGSSQTQKEAR